MDNEYVNLQINGRLFPTWILHNFKEYQLDPIVLDGKDPCKIDRKLELTKYQKFIGAYLGPTSQYTSVLLYYGLGAGKTATCINLMNILWDYNHNYTFILLIKASLRDDPWMEELEKWLERDPSESGIQDPKKLVRFKAIHFVHYDSPNADRDFLNVMKGVDTSKPVVYFIDECHNFIRNVYSNMKSKQGKRAQAIYERIMRDKKENKSNRVIMVSATPAINEPFELSLLFNLLRDNTLPGSELEFQRMFVSESSFPILDPARKNQFIRRIQGLVSYYVGATADKFAKQTLRYVDLPMSEYQYHIYRIYEKKEKEINDKMKRFGKMSQLYQTYTRQASNFVFPHVSHTVNGELRPRPGRFVDTEKLDKGKDIKDEAAKQYLESIDRFIRETEAYFMKIKSQSGRKIDEDLQDFTKGFTDDIDYFVKYYESDKPKSKLFEELYKCSPKMTAIIFNSYASPGKVQIYTGYVLMEGIDMLKVYFRVIGFDDYKKAKPNKGFCEYHGRIDKAERVKIRRDFNAEDNIDGSKCKVFMLSPSATEGIQLKEIRQSHILEPYWNEVRIEQVIGRGIRQCSHQRLPMADRNVVVYRYKVIKPQKRDEDDLVRETADQLVENVAKAKSNMIESFLMAMKEAAVDCELFREHNQMSQSYQCFKFTDEQQLTKNVGPAYVEDFKADTKLDAGLYAVNTTTMRVKVFAIQGVYPMDGSYSKPFKCWYDSKTGMAYNYELKYPIGKVNTIEGLPNKLDKDTYIIDPLVKIPTIKGKTVNP